MPPNLPWGERIGRCRCLVYIKTPEHIKVTRDSYPEYKIEDSIQTKDSPWTYSGAAWQRASGMLCSFAANRLIQCGPCLAKSTRRREDGAQTRYNSVWMICISIFSTRTTSHIGNTWILDDCVCVCVYGIYNLKETVCTYRHNFKFISNISKKSILLSQTSSCTHTP